MLMWGELAAWIVAAELAERLDDPDAKLAASSQVFDEARHFYTLRDYLAALHVPVPRLDTYFAIAARRLLATRDLTVKLFAMQILAEGTAMVIFRFLADAKIEPVLSDLLPYIERDEARHVGLGVLHLPQLLAKLSRRQLERVRQTTYGVGDLFGATQLRYARHYRALGAEPRELIRSADKMLYELSEKIGPIPGTDLKFFATNPTDSPRYEKALDVILPREGAKPTFYARAAQGNRRLRGEGAAGRLTRSPSPRRAIPRFGARIPGAVYVSRPSAYGALGSDQAERLAREGGAAI